MKDLKEEYDYLVDYAIKKGKELGISAIQFLTSDKYDWETYNEFAYHKQKYKDFIRRHLGKFVYFLMKENKIIYIGKTCCLYRRIHAHLSTAKYDFDSITFFDYSKCDITDEELSVIENFFINQHKSHIKNKHIPKLNKKLICNVLSKIENVTPVTISKEDINLL